MTARLSTDPKTVAVVGASSDRARFGNKAVRAFAAQGYTVYPVHPDLAEVEGLKCYPAIDQVPARPAIVSVYLSPPRLLNILPDIARRGCDELWLNPGADSSDVIAAAQKLGLKPIQTCSILAVGLSPFDL